MTAEPPHALRAALESCFRAGIAAADGGALVARALAGELPVPRVGARGGVHLFAAGKAAAAMALAAADWAGASLRAGLVVTKDGHGAALAGRAELRLLEAAHPLPDARSAAAGRAALDFASGVGIDGELLVLLSGGASSLLALPAEGVGLDDFAATTRRLLASGADIEELNCVRKHLSALSGGQLAIALRARRTRVLALSDVAGDRLDVIASGPFCADPSSFADAREVLQQRGLWRDCPAAVRARIEAGLRGEVPETPKPGDPRLARIEHRVVGNNATALSAALEQAGRLGFAPQRLDFELQGEACEQPARILAALRDRPLPTPAFFAVGGEPTVRVRGEGLGGRCQELALAAALALDVAPPGPACAWLAAGSDGSDGPTDAAGAHADPGTCARARALGLDPMAALGANDSHAFFAAEGGLFRTGPTGTNVRDLVLVALGSPKAAARG